MGGQTRPRNYQYMGSPKKAFIQRYCPPSMTAKQLKDIHNFKQEGDESLYQAWERYNDLLYKCPTSTGPIPGMRPTEALTAVQTMANHSQKWHNGTTSKKMGSSNSSDGLAALVNKLDNLGRDMKKLKESIHAIQAKQDEWLKTFCHNLEKSQNHHDEIIQGLKSRVTTLAKEAVTKIDNNEDCKAIFTNDGAPLYTPFYYSPEEIKRLEQHANEALIHETMESLKKIKLNQPFLKEIRQSDEYPKFMKDPVANKPLTLENEDIKINHRCSALLLNQLPPKEKDPVSFILPCSIGRLDFNNALADLGAGINIMPFSMYKRLGIGKLETIKMNIELADNSKCIPKGIVRNLLIKIDKFILPIDFIILDVLEDFRMPVILGRPLLTTAHAKVDVFKRSISLEVGNEKVIFKLKTIYMT
ncbi:hypothetical protein Tco_1182766 [Tanacetum coccineum]